MLKRDVDYSVLGINAGESKERKPASQELQTPGYGMVTCHPHPSPSADRYRQKKLASDLYGRFVSSHGIIVAEDFPRKRTKEREGGGVDHERERTCAMQRHTNHAIPCHVKTVCITPHHSSPLRATDLVTRGDLQLQHDCKRPARSTERPTYTKENQLPSTGDGFVSTL